MQTHLMPKVGIGAWLVNDGKILMGRRLDAHGLNSWGPPGGHLEFGEDPFQGAIRELKEETDLEALDVHFACWTNDLYQEEKKHYISLHMVITRYQGELKLMEPNKCQEWHWLTLEELPKSLFLSAKNFIQSGVLQKFIETSKKEDAAAN